MMKSNYFRMDNLIKLAKLKNISLEEVKENIIEARTRNSFITKDKDFIDFVLTIKNYLNPF